MAVKINKCDKNWREIGNKKTCNFCKYCEINVPDFSNYSNTKIEKELANHTCARFHERHLEEHQAHYFFINRFERKLENYGFVKITATLVFSYLMLVGCGSRRRMAGAYAYGWDYKESNDVEQVFQKKSFSESK